VFAQSGFAGFSVSTEPSNGKRATNRLFTGSESNLIVP
jgi:hypothetical protein